LSDSLLKQKIREALQKAGDDAWDRSAQEKGIDDVAPVLDEMAKEVLEKLLCIDNEHTPEQELIAVVKKWLGE